VTGSDPDLRAPGLQVERTRLAWQRSLLTTGLVTLLVVRALLRDPPGPPGRSPAMLGATVLAALTWCGAALLVRRRRRSVTRHGEPVGAAVPALLAAVALLAALGLLAVTLR